MTRTDRARFSGLLMALAEGLGESLSDARIQFYFTALSSYPIEELERTAQALSRSSRFFPKPVDFIEAMEGTASDQAMAVWNLVCDAVFRIGWSRSLFIADARLAFALEQTFGGWIQCNEQLAPLTPSDPMFASLRKAFQINYQLAARQADERQQRYFPGQLEANNRENASQWQDRPWPALADGTLVFENKVGLIRDGRVTEFVAQYEVTTGRLTDGSKQQLLGRPEPQKQLVGASV